MKIFLDDRPQPKPSRPFLPPAARYALAAIAFFTPATWLLMLLGCVKYRPWPLVCEPVNYAAAPLAIGALVLLPLGLVYLDRAQRRARKGMWQKAGGAGWGRSLQRTMRVAWGSEEDPPGLIAGEMRYQRRRWAIRVQTGQMVYVDRREFWLWLTRVEALVARLQAGQSPVSRRYWKPRIGEPVWLAYCQILEAVGAFEFRTDDTRARRYVSGGAWGRCEEYEKQNPSEPY